MQRTKHLRALFLDGRGQLSIRRVREAPARLGLVRTFVRVGIDLKRGLAVYEEATPEPPILQMTDTAGESRSSMYQERVCELVQRGLQAARAAPRD